MSVDQNRSWCCNPRHLLGLRHWLDLCHGECLDRRLCPSPPLLGRQALVPFYPPMILGRCDTQPSNFYLLQCLSVLEVASNHDYHIMGQENLPQLLQDAIYMPYKEFCKVLMDHPHLFTPEQMRVHGMMHQSRICKDASTR